MLHSGLKKTQFGVQYRKVEGSNKKCQISKYRAGMVNWYRGFNIGVCILDINLLDLIMYF